MLPNNSTFEKKATTTTTSVRIPPPPIDTSMTDDVLNTSTTSTTNVTYLYIRRHPRPQQPFPNPIITIMYFLGAANIVSWLYSLTFLSTHPLLSDKLKSLHVSICCIGTLIHYVFSGRVLMKLYVFWQYMSTAEIQVHLLTALTPMFITDFSRFCVEAHVVWEYGFGANSIVQGVSLVLTALAGGLGFVYVWLMGLWQYTGYLQSQYLKEVRIMEEKEMEAQQQVLQRKLSRRLSGMSMMTSGGGGYGPKKFVPVAPLQANTVRIQQQQQRQQPYRFPPPD
eukprot:PhF_6_TR5176/c0_g1_i1/m.7422